jgi:type IV secretory pathway VirB10-like protein
MVLERIIHSQKQTLLLMRKFGPSFLKTELKYPKLATNIVTTMGKDGISLIKKLKDKEVLLISSLCKNLENSPYKSKILDYLKKDPQKVTKIINKTPNIIFTATGITMLYNQLFPPQPKHENHSLKTIDSKMNKSHPLHSTQKNNKKSIPQPSADDFYLFITLLTIFLLLSIYLYFIVKKSMRKKKKNNKSDDSTKKSHTDDAKNDKKDNKKDSKKDEKSDDSTKKSHTNDTENDKKDNKKDSKKDSKDETTHTDLNNTNK